MNDSTISNVPSIGTGEGFIKPVGKIKGQFRIPSYQRGYRWDEEDVERLLVDLWESNGSPYSLQPIVVKPIDCSSEDTSQWVWELIDGQQRLTTLCILLQYLHKNQKVGSGSPFELSYVTRCESEDFLKQLSDQTSEEDAGKNIDFYHFYEAYRTISHWFSQQGDGNERNGVADRMHRYLSDSIRVIWYQVSAGVNHTELFTRLNVGRIPLTDAELVKAALLSTLRRGSEDRAHEVAAQWDAIERDLQRKEVWAFIAGLGAAQADEVYPTRISLLLNIEADQCQPSTVIGNRPHYRTFEILRKPIEVDPWGFWQCIISMHAYIQGWFEQPTLYNKIGFLTVIGESLNGIIKESRQRRKTAFNDYLIQRIKGWVGVTRDDIGSLGFERHASKIRELLLLMNIETVTATGHRFPFKEHVGKLWSLEHIHAQNAESLTTREQWRAWLVEHRGAMDSVSDEGNRIEIESIGGKVDEALATMAEAESKRFSQSDFQTLSARILRILSRDDEPDHSIANLALLSRDDNSALSNSVFEVKRRKILELDRAGQYVPICTRNVFLKYYADADSHQPHFWGEKDKNSYFSAICKALRPYLKPSPESSAS